MRHFPFLDDAELERLFLREPEDFGADGDPELLAMALGATLYCPGDRPRLADDIARRAGDGATSTVVCLEDSVADANVDAALDNAVSQLRSYRQRAADGPLVFVRVRSAEQVGQLIAGLGEYADVLTGFVLPKFTEASGKEYLAAIGEAAANAGARLLAMPVLEAPETVIAESRIASLLGIRHLLDAHRDKILAVRLGATDLSGVFGLRRGPEFTVYDVRVVADVIADIVNVFGRDSSEASQRPYVVTGPVWEYFPRNVRMFKPQLRQTPFEEHDERRLRAKIVTADMDGLIREIALDRANGLTGKTVIHPSHVAVVNALAVVTHEEYHDALDVACTGGTGGAHSSLYGNKMNESKPHTAWARRTLLRARVFGVAGEGISFVDLLAASLRL